MTKEEIDISGFKVELAEGIAVPEETISS